MTKASMKLRDAPLGRAFTTEHVEVPQETVNNLLTYVLARLPQEQRARAWLANIDVTMRIEAETPTQPLAPSFVGCVPNPSVPRGEVATYTRVKPAKKRKPRHA